MPQLTVRALATPKSNICRSALTANIIAQGAYLQKTNAHAQDYPILASHLSVK
jgi:hypothetical protein